MFFFGEIVQLDFKQGFNPFWEITSIKFVLSGFKLSITGKLRTLRCLWGPRYSIRKRGSITLDSTHESIDL